MGDQSTHFEHIFRYKGRRVRLICSIAPAPPDQRLVLDDVRASTQRVADDVPDWLIEAEASKAAADRQATYM